MFVFHSIVYWIKQVYLEMFKKIIILTAYHRRVEYAMRKWPNVATYSTKFTIESKLIIYQLKVSFKRLTSVPKKVCFFYECPGLKPWNCSSFSGSLIKMKIQACTRSAHSNLFCQIYFSEQWGRFAPHCSLKEG